MRGTCLIHDSTFCHSDSAAEGLTKSDDDDDEDDSIEDGAIYKSCSEPVLLNCAQFF